MTDNALYEIYLDLINSWEQTEIDEQRPIDLALSIIIQELNKRPKTEKNLERELQRFESFRHDQNKLDNVLSLLKICDRINIKYNKDIDLNSVMIDDIITNIDLLVKQKNIAQRYFKQATKDMQMLWFATKKGQFNIGDDYVFPNSNTSAKDIRKIIPYFDIEI